jgi:hypothetical protein
MPKRAANICTAKAWLQSRPIASGDSEWRALVTVPSVGQECHEFHLVINLHQMENLYGHAH